LSEKLGKGGVGVGVDGGAEIVVVAAESLQDKVEKLIIIKGFSRSSKFSSDTLHLGEIFVGGEVVLACTVEARAKLLDPGLGLARDVGVEGCPDRSRGVEADDMSEYIGRQSIDKPSQNLLVTGNPCLIVGVDDDNLLVVGVFGGDELIGRLVLAFNKVKNASAPQCRDHQRLPHERVFTRQRLGWGRSESSGESSSRHRRGGGHELGSRRDGGLGFWTCCAAAARSGGCSRFDIVCGLVLFVGAATAAEEDSGGGG
jgi:hypothetical protein